MSSFGEQWNYFNFVQFKEQWLNHTVKNTWSDTSVFKDKIIIDAGGGSGAQGKWFLEYGAKHVIILDLSQSLDDVAIRNLKNADPSKFDLIQCSIDNPPLRDNSISGLVYCHNVIQHTPSVEKTLKALYKVLLNGGELAFNCYQLNDKGLFRWIRFHLAHAFQWHLSNKEVKQLLDNLNPKPTAIKNKSKYFERPQPIGCALRVIK